MEERNWLHCTLCRSGREGASTLQRAHLRNVTWPEPNTSLAAPIQVCVQCLTSVRYLNVLSGQILQNEAHTVIRTVHVRNYASVRMHKRGIQ